MAGKEQSIEESERQDARSDQDQKSRRDHVDDVKTSNQKMEPEIAGRTSSRRPSRAAAMDKGRKDSESRASGERVTSRRAAA